MLRQNGNTFCFEQLIVMFAIRDVGIFVDTDPFDKSVGRVAIAFHFDDCVPVRDSYLTNTHILAAAK